MAGHWFDLQSSWALSTCCRSFGSCGGSSRYFVLGCPLAAAALEWCTVLQDRWVLPHYAVRAPFSVVVGRLGLVGCLFSGLLPGLPAVIGLGVLSLSRFVVLGRCTMNLCCPFILPFGRVSVLLFWLVMFLLLGLFGRFRLRFLWFVPLSVLVALFLRLDFGWDAALLGQAVHLFKVASVSRVLLLRRRLCCVLSVLDGISGHGLTLSRDLELGVQWDAVVAAGPCGPLCGAILAVSPAVGLPFRFCMMPLLISCIRLLFTVGMSLCVIGVLGCWKMTIFILTAGLNLTWWLRDPGLY